MTFKLGQGAPGSSRAVVHPDVYERQRTTGDGRLCLAPRSGHVDLMRALARTWSDGGNGDGGGGGGAEADRAEGAGGCAVLYVLLVARLGKREPGRYQSPAPLRLEEAEEFLERFQEFFECDGRHHVWLASRNGAVLVYDHHQWIYAYGDLDAYERVARERGLTPGKLELPVPHSHHYHAAFDDEEDAVIGYWEWTGTPLCDGDA
jgi:hypothetical protein